MQKKRHISKEGRARIAEAQRLRWAKVRNGNHGGRMQPKSVASMNEYMEGAIAKVDSEIVQRLQKIEAENARLAQMKQLREVLVKLDRVAKAA